MKIDLLHMDNQDFLKMSGIAKDSGSIIKMSFDKNNNSYLLTEKYANNVFISTIYKCLAGQTEFKLIFKVTDGIISSINIDTVKK